MKNDRKLQGSVLVVAIMVLSIIIIIALSVSLVSLRESKNTSGESHSGKAFQSADAGIEVVMNEILKNGYTTVKQLSNCQADETIKSAGYTIQLYDASGGKINCSGSSPIASVFSLKSVGAALGQSRAIEAVVPVSMLCTGVGVNTSDLVGHWEFDESAGTMLTAADEISGNSAADCLTSSAINHASVDSSPIFMSEDDRDFIRFNDGSGKNCAVIQDRNEYHLAIGTVSFWVRYRNIPTSWDAIFSKDANMCDLRTNRNNTLSNPPDNICNFQSSDSVCNCGHLTFATGGSSIGDNFGLRFQSDGNFGNDSGHYGLVNDTSKTDFHDGDWHLVTLTFSPNQYILYVDGEVHKQFNKTGSLDDSGGGVSDFDGILEGLEKNDWRIWLGSLYHDIGYSETDLDDLRIYNKELSECEVEMLFDGT